jgi:F-type H+-transporting ATPase subunit b
MHFHVWTFLLQTLNFVVLVWLLRRFLYRPVLATIEQRRQQTERLMREAEAAKQASATAQATLDGERTKIATDRDQLLAQARADVEAERRAIVERAQVEAASIVAAARAEMARHEAQAEAALRDRAAELATAMAHRLLESPRDAEATEVLLREALDMLAAMPSAERRAILDGKIEIVSARPLSTDERESCRQRLATLAEHVDLAFAEEPALIAGVELHLHDWVLHHSWRDALAEARAALVRDGDAG